MTPNIVIFNPDQMRSDSMGHMGNMAAVTPNIDQFVSTDAVSFRYAYCQNTVCVPSRCSFLTGQYPHTKGHRTMNHMLQLGESTLLSELKNAGYYVWMNPRNDFLAAQLEGIFEQHASETFYGGNVAPEPGPLSPGKERYSFYYGELKLDENGKNFTIDDESVEEAIRKISAQSGDTPFCLFLGLQLPHPPYGIEEPYFSSIDKNKMPPRIRSLENLDGKPEMVKKLIEYQKLQGLSEEDWDDIRSCYQAMVMKTDQLFGRVLDSLKENQLYEDTAVFLFSDHGDYTGDYGLVEKTQNTFEECLVRVPFIVKPPKGIKVDPGISESLVELVDVYATIMDFAEVAPDHTHFGRSLRSVLEERKNPHRTQVFCEGGRLAGEIHCDESNGKTMSPYNPYFPRRQAQLDDVAHTKASMIRNTRYKYIRRLYEPDELYDLVTDTQELKNLADQAEYRQILCEMKLGLLDWYQETCDAVPFQQDSRFNSEIIWSRVKNRCPDYLERDVKEKIRNGVDLYQLIEWIKQNTK